MEIIIASDGQQSAELAADIFEKQLTKKPDSVLGLATGSTPVPLYDELVRRHREEGLDFSHVTTFNLDEYFGLPDDHPQSYRRFMQEKLFDRVNVSRDQTHLPPGQPVDVEAACEAYEERIVRAGGIDLQLLGVGADGHIGFNEPGSSLGSRTRLKALTKQTIADNARFFDHPDQVPQFAITMGVGTILDAKRIVLMATGRQKARIVAEFVEGPITAQVTASALQWHRSVTIIVDKEAASQLKRSDYYRWVYEQKRRREDSG